MKLIVGLGNIGPEYSQTRHNIGFIFLDKFIEQNNIGVRNMDKKSNAEIIKANVGGEDIIFIKPQTFMNRSGFSVGYFANFFKVEPENVLVIQDDIDMECSKVRLKLGGSAGGHNGIKDITLKLGTELFWRLKIGIGRPADNNFVADYVLSKFQKAELDKIDTKESDIFKHINEFMS